MAKDTIKESELEEHLGRTGGKSFVYFIGERKNGKSWCPDCVESDAVVSPVVRELASTLDRPFVEVEVPRENWMGNTSHPFRQPHVYGLKGLPSIAKLPEKIVIDVVECKDDKKIRALLQG
eukprot:Clim_evm161s157 gene=Clim_evmTU161s157